VAGEEGLGDGEVVLITGKVNGARPARDWKTVITVQKDLPWL
jgi:hypothetical protein